MRELKVPYALNAKAEVVSASTALRMDSFTCLECAQRLVLRRGPRQRPHFSHLADALKMCTGESVFHLAAKHLLREQVEQELKEHRTIRYQSLCLGVEGECRYKSVHTHEIPMANWDAVELEVTYKTYRLDVAITQAGQAIFGFEVFFKHEVPEEKAADLDIPWLELLAEDILNFKPRIPWSSPEAPFRCPQCVERLRLLEERAKVTRRRNKVNDLYHLELLRVSKTWQEVLKRAGK